jgi:hypothetical protein
MFSCEAVDSVAHHLRRGKLLVPTLASPAERPDIKGVQVVEDMEEKLDRQPVERVTGVGYCVLDKLQAVSVLGDSADQAGEAGRGSVKRSMDGMFI